MPKDATCPICFDALESDSWQRLWCGCHVCNTCCGGWARAALESAAGAANPPAGADANGQPAAPLIALSCPACAAPLRPCDAAAVLGRDDALLVEYDSALRDAALRGMRDWRPCPQCKGGGFVTWGCVGERRLATRWRALCAGVAILGGLIAAGSHRLLAAAADEVHVATGDVWTLSGVWSLRFLIGAAACSHAVAAAARALAAESSADAPLNVECPDCTSRFALAATDAAADAAAGGRGSGGAGAGDDAWVRENTRPCPSCKSPILKHGGCNAMRCGRCRLQFCWCACAYSWRWASSPAPHPLQPSSCHQNA